MSLFNATIVDDYRDYLAKDERRYDNYGACSAVANSTPYVDFISPEAKNFFMTASSERNIKIPVFKDGEVVVNSTPSFDTIPSNLLESDTYGFTAIDVFTGFDFHPTLTYENQIDAQEGKMMQMKRVMDGAKEVIDTHCVNIMNTHKTQVLEGLDQINGGDGTYTFGVDNTLVVDKAGVNETVLYDYDGIMKYNLLDKENMLVTSKGGMHQVKRALSKYGANNEKNLSWSSNMVNPNDIYETPNIDNNSNLYEGYLVQKGSLGIFENHPPDFLAGSTLSDQQWSVASSAVPGIGLKPNIFTKRVATDSSGLTGRGTASNMAIKETIAFWFRFYLVYKYNSDNSTRVSDIVKIRATKS